MFSKDSLQTLNFTAQATKLIDIDMQNLGIAKDFRDGAQFPCSTAEGIGGKGC